MLVLECGGVDVDGILVFVDNGRPEEYDDVDVTAVFLAFLLLKVFSSSSSCLCFSASMTFSNERLNPLFQSVTMPSLPPHANILPSAVNAAQFTEPSCALSVHAHRWSRKSQIFVEPSAEVVARKSPAGCHCTSVIASRCE